MDRFVIASNKQQGENAASEGIHPSLKGNDLLSLLKGRQPPLTQKRKHQEIVQEEHEAENNQRMILPKKEIKKEWEARENATLSTFDLNCLQRQEQLKARNYVGWKMDREGNKVYTTFRNGQKVQVSGQEGFRLALADGNIKKTKKQVIEEYKDFDEDRPEKKIAGMKSSSNNRIISFLQK